MLTTTATIESAARRFGGWWNLAFFTSAICVCVAATVGFVDALAKGAGSSLFDLIDLLYLLAFGLIMLVVDAPLDCSSRFASAKMTIYKYLLFMTRFTCRGIWYVFLGVMIVGTLWDNELSPWLGLLLGGYVMVIGSWSMWQGFSKSLKLERVRCRVNERINELADLVEASGMTKQQFGAMSAELVGDGSRFTDEDLNYIVNALSFSVRADDVISRREFAEWTRGSMTLL